MRRKKYMIKILNEVHIIKAMKKDKSTIFKKVFKTNLIPLIVFFLTFTIYTRNLLPTVFGGDTGDFLSAIITKGVPHPSGYPLYTAIGILFNSLPLGHTSAWRVGLASSLFAALGVVFMYLISLELTKNKIISAITAFILAFTYPYWIYAEVVEVISLHTLFILAIVFFTIKYINTKSKIFLYIIAFSCGLSLTNNLTIILLFPGVALSVLLANPKFFKDYKTILKMFALFLLGLVPYAYIPIAASKYPIVNWDRAVNLKNFTDLILRRDYGWISKDKTPFIPIESMKSFFIYWNIYSSLLYIPLFLTGLINIFLKKKIKVLIFLLLGIIFFGPVFLIYTKTPSISLSALSTLERFYIPPMMIAIIFFSEGISLITKLFQKFLHNKMLKILTYYLTLAAFAVIPVSLFFQNNKKTDLSNIFIGEMLAKNVLAPLDKNSFLFVANDEFAFNTLYIQHEQNFRSDVTIPGRNTGFEKFLEVSKVIPPDEINSYLIKNRNTIEQKELYGGIVSLLESGHSVYSTVPKLIIEDKLGKLATIPYGLVYKFVIGKNNVPSEKDYIKQEDEIWATFDLPMFDKHSDVVDYSLSLSNIKKHYSVGYKNIANFMNLYYKNDSMYMKYLNLAIQSDPILGSED